MSSKGIVPAFVIYGAAMVLIGAALLLIFVFRFNSQMEITISDKIADGLSSINYFYLTEKNINEFAQIVTEITAKELGEKCGGFDCYKWSANNPSYKDLRDKFESELRGKITGFAKQIGNLGRLSFEPPRISGLEMDENNVKISLEPQQVYRKTDSFLVNASSEKRAEIDKNIRYLLLARIGQQLYGNGTYVRDSGKIWVNSGKFDCNNDGFVDKTISARTRLSDSSLNNCKILDIDFNIDDIEGGKSKWNSYASNCYGIASSADPGKYAGKIEGGKIYVQIDSLLEKSLVCGIDATDGLASINDIKGEVSKSGTSQPTCTADDAKNNAWQNSGVDSKINSILIALQSQISTTYGGITIAPAVNTNIQNSEVVVKNPPFGGKTSCDSCTEWNPASWAGAPSGQAATGNPRCSWSNGNSGTFCSWTSGYDCAYYGNADSGRTSTSANYMWSGSSMCGMYSNSMSRQQNWGDGVFSESRYDHSASRGTSGSGDTYYSDTYSCYLGAYYKFTFTPDITFKITDTAGDKIVVKGGTVGGETPRFENLYFAVKFKPSEPYVIGDPDFIPPTEYTCEKTSGQACEPGSSCPSGKAQGSGTCESGKVCCKTVENKPPENKIIITGEGKDITI